MTAVGASQNPMRIDATWCPHSPDDGSEEHAILAHLQLAARNSSGADQSAGVFADEDVLALWIYNDRAKGCAIGL